MSDLLARREMREGRVAPSYYPSTAMTALLLLRHREPMTRFGKLLYTLQLGCDSQTVALPRLYISV